MSGIDDEANHLLDSLVERAVEERQVVINNDLALNVAVPLVQSVNPVAIAGVFKLDHEVRLRLAAVFEVAPEDASLGLADGLDRPLPVRVVLVGLCDQAVNHKFGGKGRKTAKKSPLPAI